MKEILNDDEMKILTHLFYRKDWVREAEIKQAWKFEDFDAAVKTLVDKELIGAVGLECRITKHGRETLKEKK